jgi:hypothetical protein
LKPRWTAVQGNPALVLRCKLRHTRTGEGTWSRAATIKWKESNLKGVSMPDLDIPLPGDGLFFESADKKDTFGTAISATQKAKGLEHYKYIHAALVVNNDLVEYRYRRAQDTTIVSQKSSRIPSFGQMFL